MLSSAWEFRHSQGYKKRKNQEGFENKAHALCRLSALSQGGSEG